MAKELEKFVGEHKKLKATYKGFTKSNTSTATQRLRMANATTGTGEDNIRSAIVKARKAGVSGDKFEDFAKNAGFKQALVLQNKAAKDLDDEIKNVDTLGEDIDKAMKALTKLFDAMQKDLAKRKDSSASKKDIDALTKEIEKDFQILNDAMPSKTAINGMMRNYSKNLPKEIAKILKEDAGAVESKIEGQELPHLLTDRNLKKNVSICVARAKDIKTLCDKALEKAGDGDKKAAMTGIKEAMEKHKEIKPIADQYTSILTKYKDDIGVSKDKKKIEEGIATMVKMEAGAERMISGLATTLKKAG